MFFFKPKSCFFNCRGKFRHTGGGRHRGGQISVLLFHPPREQRRRQAQPYPREGGGKAIRTKKLQHHQPSPGSKYAGTFRQCPRRGGKVAKTERAAHKIKGIVGKWELLRITLHQLYPIRKTRGGKLRARNVQHRGHKITRRHTRVREPSQLHERKIPRACGEIKNPRRRIANIGHRQRPPPPGDVQPQGENPVQAVIAARDAGEEATNESSAGARAHAVIPGPHTA